MDFISNPEAWSEGIHYKTSMFMMQKKEAF